MFDEKAFKNFMLDGILTEEEYNFISNRTKMVDENACDILQYVGCFSRPINSNKITDFRLLVPVIKDLKSMLVNIHEYTHAVLLYRHIYYGLKLDETEIIPIENEKKYLKKINRFK